MDKLEDEPEMVDKGDEEDEDIVEDNRVRRGGKAGRPAGEEQTSIGRWKISMRTKNSLTHQSGKRKLEILP